MVSVNYPSYTLAYDALGRCVTRTLNNATTFYLYDGEKPIVEFDSTGAVAARNLYGKGIDEILMRTVPANNWTLCYQQNHEGSVTLVTNASGGVIEKYRYDAFGAPTFYDANWNLINYSTFNNRFLFTGREYAAATLAGYNAGFTFYEYRARAYNPTLGRFMSEDPKLFDAGDYNLFRYCHNDPVDFTDPMGLMDMALLPGPNHATPLMMLAEMTKWFDRSNIIQGMFSGFAAMSGQSDRDAKGGLVTGRTEGTNSGLGIPKQTNDTGFAAAKPELDRAYDVVKQTRDREMTGPVGQVDGFTSGHLFAEPFTAGPGVQKTGKYAGDQVSFIGDLPARLPKGTHLYGYYTVHPHRVPSRLKGDAANFEGGFGIKAHIWMMSPGKGGLGGNWEKPEYFPYPSQW